MTEEQISQEEIDESKKLLERVQKEITYKRDLYQRIELLTGCVGILNNPQSQISDLVETKINQIILKINVADSIIVGQIT